MSDAGPSLDRNAPCRCGSGRRYKNCCYGRDRGRADLLSSAAGSHRALDEVLGAILPLVESRGEYHLACKAGCNACCSQLIRVTWAEALLIAAWLLEEEQSAILARFEETLPQWRSANPEALVTVEAMIARHRGAPAEGPDQEAYIEAGRAWNRAVRMCPFNDPEGRCSIYPVRPMPCRATWVLETPDRCRPGSPEAPHLLKHPSLQGAIIDLRQLLLGAADRTGGHPAERALPNFVADALVELRAVTPPGAPIGPGSNASR